MRNFIAAFLLLLVAPAAFAQHASQVDGGAGNYGIIDGSALPPGTTIFTLPPVGGEFVVIPPSGPALIWLTGGNELSGTLPSSPDQVLGSTNGGDVVMVAGNDEKMRLIYGESRGVSVKYAELDINGANYNWPASYSEGTTLLTNDGIGNLSWTNGFISTIAGTANQVYVNGGILPLSGPVTLSTPQDIAQTSSPTFFGMTLTDPALQNRIAFINGSGVLTTIGPASPTLSTLASALTGQLGVANGGTGVDGSTAGNGQLLIGNGTGFSINSLTGSGGITITPGAGTINIDGSGVGSSAQILFARKTSDESLQSTGTGADTTMQADNDLFFSLGANEVWEIDGVLFDTSVAANVEKNFMFTAPAGTTLTIHYTAFLHSAPGNYALNGEGQGILLGPGDYGKSDLDPTRAHSIYFKGIVAIGGTSGTLAFNWAYRNIPGGTNRFLVVRAGSYLKATRIQ